MNIQPVSLINFSAKTNNTNVSHKKSTVSQDSGKQTNNIDAKRLVNAMQALALSSAIAFTPAMVSCGKDEIEDYPLESEMPIEEYAKKREFMILI